MNAPIQNDDAMREALQRDAAQVSEPPFNAALHHATMRRIRTLAEPAERTARFGLLPAFAAGAAVLILGALALLWRPHPPSRGGQGEAIADFAPRASLLAYQIAANRSDDALFATLDRDARDLLPASPSAFTSTLR